MRLLFSSKAPKNVDENGKIKVELTHIKKTDYFYLLPIGIYLVAFVAFSLQIQELLSCRDQKHLTLHVTEL
jgi:hypothetical protein